MLLEMNVKMRRGHFNLSTQLSVDSNSMGLFGKSGAGKSTVLGLIAGIIQPESGQIVLNGKILFDSSKGILVPREQRAVGAVLQTDCDNLTGTVRDNLTHAYQRTLQHRRLLKLDFLIDLLELEPLLDQAAEKLSVGERQRVALARSLLKSPQLLLLDETFAAMSNNYRLPLLQVLRRLQDELRLPALYASQSLAEILELTDRLIVLDQGKVLRIGSLREIAKQKGILRYLGLHQIDTILPVTIRCHDDAGGCTLADCFGLPLALPLRSQLVLGSQTLVSFRANDVALSRQYIDGISIQNQLKGQICSLIGCGESLIVQVDCGNTLLAEITPRACQDMGLREGDTVYCLIKTHAIRYLAEVDSLPAQRVLNHDNGRYYLISQ